MKKDAKECWRTILDIPLSFLKYLQFEANKHTCQAKYK